MVLAIVGLAGLVANLMASIGTIIIGAAILMDGMAYRQFPAHSRWAQTRGLSAEFLGGVAGIVLGILALFGTYPAILLGVALIVFGSALFLNTIEFLQWQRFAGAQEGVASQDAHAFAFGPGGQLMVGLAAVVLGILAVIGLSPLTLTLVGVLGLGFSALCNTIETRGLLMHSTHSR